MTKGQPVWPKRFPRKPKAKAVAKRELKQASKRLAAKPSRLVVTAPQSLPKSGKHESRRRAVNAPLSSQLTERAKRLQAGRTVTVALMLARFHVFQPLQQDSSMDTLPPTRGLNAFHKGTDVFIVDLFTRWGSELADVAARDLATWQGADCPQSAADWCWFALQGQGFDTWHCALGEDTEHGRS